MLNAIASNYKGFINGQTDKQIVLRNWTAAFEFVPFDAAMNAVTVYMQKNRFAPGIADIFELVPVSCMDPRRYDPDGTTHERLRALCSRLTGEVGG